MLPLNEIPQGLKLTSEAALVGPGRKDASHDGRHDAASPVLHSQTGSSGFALERGGRFALQEEIAEARSNTPWPFDLEDLRRALQQLLGCDVDVVDSAGLQAMRERVLREAVSL